MTMTAWEDGEMSDADMVGNIIERHPGGYHLDIFDHRSKSLQRMDEYDLQGGGPTWLGLLTAALEMESPTTLEWVEFDDEADNLRVTCSHKPPLAIVQTYAALLMTDDEFWHQCVEHALDGGYLE